MTNTASTTASEPGRIVVGTDGSKSSTVALHWAARQARLSGAPLTVVTTWEFPTSYGYPFAWTEDMDFATSAQAVLDEAVNDIVGSDPTINVTAAVLEGHAALVLVEQSKRAALLVVGSRGHGEFSGMLLGSVSQFAATHAHCPVVIIRDGSEAFDET